MSQRSRGRPPFEPTPEQRRMVEAMASCGIREDDIALVLQIARNTLRLHFTRELAVSAPKANAKVAATLFEIATNKNHAKCVDAAKFWLARRAGWKEPTLDQAERFEPLGKKELAAEAARTAGVGSEWGDDLFPPDMTPSRAH